MLQGRYFPSYIEVATFFVDDVAPVGTLVAVATTLYSRGVPNYSLSGDDAALLEIDAALGDIIVAFDLPIGTLNYIVSDNGSVANPPDLAVSQTIDPGPVVVEPVTSFTVFSATSDTTPDLRFTLPASAVAGYTIFAEVSVAESDEWSSYFPPQVLSAEDILADAITASGAELAAGSYDFRVRLGVGSDFSTWATLEDQVVT